MKRGKERWFSLFLAGVCTALLLTGCGEGESVHTGAKAQSEEAAETAEETDTGTPEKIEETEATEPTEQEAATGEQVTEPAEDTEAEGESTEQAQQSGPWNKGSREQMELDEETRKELTKELLEEENMDTSVMEGRTTTGFSFDIPEGFEESEEEANLYVRKRYPIDASTIYYAEMEEDISLQLLTKEAFMEQMKADLQDVYGEDVEIAVDSFEHVEISGYPAFRILCHYTVGGVEITQLQYAINADRSYMITYSQTSDYDYMELYEASAATIEVK